VERFVKKRKIMLDPAAVTEEKTIRKSLEDVGVAGDFGKSEIEITYANWKYKEILDAVLPSNLDSVSSYSRVGHVIHLNLREELSPYKFLIGQVLLDKIPNVRTVVNKSSNINSTYRFFEMELLAGVNETEVEVVECGCKFTFDFAKVYWNPRLSTEHERMVKMFRQDDVVLDVFAGVGPFAVPAAKKKCRVYANDLNPEAFAYLKKNAEKNKVHYECFNLDGSEFIAREGSRILKQFWKENWEEPSGNEVHFLMNLPAIAVDFLPAFVGLMEESGYSAKQFIDRCGDSSFFNLNFTFP
jgi:tRNA (guanine37-N1)-methyltransferase